MEVSGRGQTLSGMTFKIPALPGTDTIITQRVRLVDERVLV